MRILGHIHTLNDDDVIDRSLGALLAQTYPLDEILIVDNGSTDNTLRRSFHDKVTVIRNEKNVGTSGAVLTGFKYALGHGYDWIWVFDADTAPCEDALEKLLKLYESFPPEVQEQTRLLASLPVEFKTRHPYHGLIFDHKGSHEVIPDGNYEFYELDAPMWTGSLYKLKAIRRIGLPLADYVLDWGEFEYGYRGKLAGLRAFVHTKSIAHHNIGGQTSLVWHTCRFGPFSLTMCDFPPIRCYYLIRNLLYFWFHEYKPRRLTVLLLLLFKATSLTLNFLVRPRTRKAEWIACLRGIWDGLFKNLHHRY